MARTPKPWYRKDRKSWFVTVEGTRHNLGRNKQEAFQKFHELMAAPIKPNKLTVFDVMDEFLEWTLNHRAKGTYRFYRERLKLYVDENSNIECSNFRPFHFQKWLDGKPNWGPTYKAGMVTTIKRCFNWAVRQGYLQTSPVQFLEKPKTKSRDTPLTRQEYDAILANIDETDPFYDLVVFSWATGSRPQESLRFTRADVDVSNMRIVIKNPKARGPKWRVIHLTNKALEIVQKHTNIRKEGPVFRNTKGKPWTPNSCANRFDRLKPKVGRTVALYDFRHAYGTDMLKNGVSPLTVAELMGHTNVKMLMETYQHISLDPKYMNQQVEKRST
jgi:integrase